MARRTAVRCLNVTTAQKTFIVSWFFGSNKLIMHCYRCLLYTRDIQAILRMTSFLCICTITKIIDFLNLMSATLPLDLT